MCRPPVVTTLSGAAEYTAQHSIARLTYLPNGPFDGEVAEAQLPGPQLLGCCLG